MSVESATASSRKSRKGGGSRPAVVLLGGAGAMGRIALRDLYESAPDLDLVVADANRAEAARLARSLPGRRVRHAAADVRDPRATALLLRDAYAVVNATQHDWNLPVMEAALASGTHYLDLGGLFHVTRRQLRLHGAFRRAGLLALLGMGAAPGITNLLARLGADAMDSVREIHCYVAGADPPGARRSGAALDISYSIQTVLEEASLPAALFSGGRLRFVEPLSGEQVIRFPEPVGRRRPACTIHSELATLPRSYRADGIREASFRIAFSEDLVSKLRFLRDAGLLSDDPVAVDGARVAPRAAVVAALRRLPKPRPGPGARRHRPAPGYEILRALVRGRRGGRRVEEVLDCHVTGVPAWGLGLDSDTGCPPSICVQLLARGEIGARGVLPPERAVPTGPFFAALSLRGMRVVRRRRYST